MCLMPEKLKAPQPVAIPLTPPMPLSRMITVSGLSLPVMTTVSGVGWETMQAGTARPSRAVTDRRVLDVRRMAGSQGWGCWLGPADSGLPREVNCARLRKCHTKVDRLLGQLPDAPGPVGRGGRESLAVRGKGDRDDRASGAVQGPALLPGVRVPHPDPPVEPTGRGEPASRRDGQARHRVRVPGPEPADEFLGGRLKLRDVPARGPDDETVSLRYEVGTGHVVPALLHGPLRGVRFHLPECESVGPGGAGPRAVVGQGNDPGRLRRAVSGVFADQLDRLHIPDADPGPFRTVPAHDHPPTASGHGPVLGVRAGPELLDRLGRRDPAKLSVRKSASNQVPAAVGREPGPLVELRLLRRRLFLPGRRVPAADSNRDVILGGRRGHMLPVGGEPDRHEMMSRLRDRADVEQLGLGRAVAVWAGSGFWTGARVAAGPPDQED